MTSSKKAIKRRSAKSPVSPAAEASALRQRIAALRAEVQVLETARFEAEVSRHRYATLYNFAPAGYVTFNALGRIDEVNVTTAIMLGQSREAMLKSPFALYVERPQLDRFLAHLHRCRDSTGRVVTELDLIRKDRSILPAQLVTRRVALSQREGAVLYQTAITDLTERKRMESELRESEERLRLALEGAHAGIWEIDLATGQAIWSDEFYRLLGLEPGKAQVAHDTWLSYLHPGGRADAETLAQRILKGEVRDFHGEFRLRHPANEERWLGLLGRALLGEGGNPPRMTGIGIDITERKRAEKLLLRARATLEQRVKDRTRDLQLANAELERQIADRRLLEQQLLEASEREQCRIGQDLHDGLGQELTGMILLTSVLQKNLARLHLSSEAAAAARLGQLFEGAHIHLRDIARGLQPIEAEPHGLVAGLDHFAATISELYQIPCRFECAAPVLMHDYAAASHLFRIAQEAADNAFRHGRAKQIVIELKRRDRRLVLEIRDDGCGMPTRLRKKSGLGLRFMRHRAEALGGSVEVRRAPAGGTWVYCSVPDTRPEALA